MDADVVAEDVIVAGNIRCRDVTPVQQVEIAAVPQAGVADERQAARMVVGVKAGLLEPSVVPVRTFSVPPSK